MAISSVVILVPTHRLYALVQTEEKLSSLMETIEQLQDSTSNYCDEKKRLKQNESERNEKDWSANISQLNQVNVFLIHCSARRTILYNTELDLLDCVS